MKVYLNKISGYEEAITSMFMSKRSWTREKEKDIQNVCGLMVDRDGKMNPQAREYPNNYELFDEWMTKLVKWGTMHITMLRYIDFSVTVEGLHRAGQDDWDAHAMRYNNRIIRSSTRLAKFGNEKSEFYKGKIITTDEALPIFGIEIPDKLVTPAGDTFVKVVNGYVREDLKDDKDVLRGLYMLSIPSNFTFKVNLTEFAHVYKERNKDGRANPEVKECCEAIADQIEEWCPYFTRELLMNIKN